MCIAIFKPKDKIIPKDYLRNAFENNSDGAGFLVHDAHTNELLTYKGFFTFNDFWNAYKAYQRMKCVLHFRIRTSGLKDERNCHPFMVNANLGFVHNGVIQIKRPAEDFSDTWHFNLRIRHYVEHVPHAWRNDRLNGLFQRLNSKEFKSISLGSSKFIFLDSRGNHAIFNEKAGTWENGVWYSNTSYKGRGRSCSINKTTKATSTHYEPSSTHYPIVVREEDGGRERWRDRVFNNAAKIPGVQRKGSKRTGSNRIAIEDLKGFGTHFETNAPRVTKALLPSRFSEETVECVKCNSIVPTARTSDMGHGHRICTTCAPKTKAIYN